MFFSLQSIQSESVHLEVQCNPRVCAINTFSCSQGSEWCSYTRYAPLFQNQSRSLSHEVRCDLRSWVRRCQGTCSSPVFPSTPSILLCRHSLSLLWLSPSSGETTAAGTLHILYLQKQVQMLFCCHHLITLYKEKPHLQAIHWAITLHFYKCICGKQSVVDGCI